MSNNIHIGQSGPDCSPYQTDGEAGSIQDGVLQGTLTYHVGSLQEAKTYGPAYYEGAPLTQRQWKWSGPDEGYDITLTYSGPDDNDSASSEGTVELDVSFSERPLAQHPNLDKILKVYQGKFDPRTREVTFSPQISLNSGGGLQGNSRKATNPMFGVETYLYLAAVVRQTKIESKPPDLDVIGSVVNRVPGGYKTPKDHDWMRMPPKSRKLTNGDYENQYEFLMSEKGGWPKHVYGFLIEGRGSLSGSSGGPLSTGSLSLGSLGN